MTKEEASNQINDIKTELAKHLLKKDIEALDVAISALKGYEGMTNGEVLKALFPNMKVHEYTKKAVLNGLGDEFQIQSMAWKNWWNSPYKGVSE